MLEDLTIDDVKKFRRRFCREGPKRFEFLCAFSTLAVRPSPQLGGGRKHFGGGKGGLHRSILLLRVSRFFKIESDLLAKGIGEKIH